MVAVDMVELNCVSVKYGLLCAVTIGAMKMLLLSVGS